MGSSNWSCECYEDEPTGGFSLLLIKEPRFEGWKYETGLTWTLSFCSVCFFPSQNALQTVYVFSLSSPARVPSPTPPSRGAARTEAMNTWWAKEQQLLLKSSSNIQGTSVAGLRRRRRPCNRKGSTEEFRAKLTAGGKQEREGEGKETKERNRCFFR